jgi:UDP-N-acetylmuramoylalanine--D-glutamate ligase
LDCGYTIGDYHLSNIEIKMSKKIVILGAGESGTGAALLAKSKGYDVFVSDQGQIKERYKIELTNANIAFEEGIHTEEKIVSASLVIKSPGIPEKAPIVKKLHALGVEIIDEIEFASRYLTGKVIAITGTNGKTTTTLLTYHLLKEAGYNVGLAGNVGFSLARQVVDGAYDWYVLELSSFQLDGTYHFRPEIGILLNITPDHLDRYAYTLQNYVDSKFRLIQQMGEVQQFIFFGDDAIIGAEIEKRSVASKQWNISLVKPTQVFFNGKAMQFDLRESFEIAQEDTTLKGAHNMINTMAAVTAAYLAGINVESIRASLKTFKNAAHRLELIATINGVDFVNDSKATNVDAVVYALGSYDKPLIWIAGGVDKGNDYGLIQDVVKQKVKALICLGKDNQKLKDAFKDSVSIIQETERVDALVRMALSLAQPGDLVLLSPACASFDLFKNYEDRGDQFRKAVLTLKEEVGS